LVHVHGRGQGCIRREGQRFKFGRGSESEKSSHKTECRYAQRLSAEKIEAGAIRVRRNWLVVKKDKKPHESASPTVPIVNKPVLRTVKNTGKPFHESRNATTNVTNGSYHPEEMRVRGKSEQTRRDVSGNREHFLTTMP